MCVCLCEEEKEGIRGGILPRLRGFEQKLKSVVDDDHFHENKIDGGKKKNLKQSESIFGLSTFCHILKLFPDVHCCSGFQKLPREQTSSLAENVLMKQE